MPIIYDSPSTFHSQSGLYCDSPALIPLSRPRHDTKSSNESYNRRSSTYSSDVLPFDAQLVKKPLADRPVGRGNSIITDRRHSITSLSPFAPTSSSENKKGKQPARQPSAISSSRALSSKSSISNEGSTRGLGLFFPKRESTKDSFNSNYSNYSNENGYFVPPTPRSRNVALPGAYSASPLRRGSTGYSDYPNALGITFESGESDLDFSPLSSYQELPPPPPRPHSCISRYPITRVS